MKFLSRLRVYEHFGRMAIPEFTYNLTTDNVWKAIQLNGGAKGVRRYRKTDQDEDESDNFTNTNALGLDYRLVFPTTINNNLSAWIAGSTLSQTHFAVLPDPFVGAASALAYEYGSTGLAGYISSPSAGGLEIGKNGAFTVRFFLYKPHKSVTLPVFTLRWHKYQFQIIKGKAAIMRLSPAWSQAKEDAMHVNMGRENPTQAQEDSIVATKKEIYKDYKELDLGDSDDWYMKFNTVTFIPEPRGQVSIIKEGAAAVVAEHTDVIATRKAGVLWEKTPLTIRNNSGAFIWQAGYPVFARKGEVRFGQYKTGYFTDSLNDTVFRGMWDTSNPGTSITFKNEAINSVYSEIVATFTTTDTRHTPFLYSLQAYIQAVPNTRGYGGTPVWDSNNYLIHNEHPPIYEISPASGCHGNTFVGGYDVTLLDVNGNLNLPGFHYNAFENRLVELQIAGDPVLRKGIVKRGDITSFRDATPNKAHLQVMKAETQVHLEIADLWHILDESLFTTDPIGDGVYLGQYIRNILTGAGFTSAEIAGVGANTGRRLPSAALGEEPAIRPDVGQSRGDFIRSLLDRYGMNLKLSCMDGVWTLNTQVTAPKAAFTTQDSSSRFMVKDPLDVSRDYADFYNYISVEGAKDYSGRPLTGDWMEYDSVKVMSQSKAYIGRFKPLPPIKDDSIRTLSDMAYVVRSLRNTHCCVGRFLKAETFFHPHLRSGDYVTLDGVLCQIMSLGGSMRDDSMSITLQEIN